MTSALNIRCKNMILGALIADAATMGLHWIYDQPHIRKIAPEKPEFTPAHDENYDGVPGYFAHDGRENGAQSQYGEQAMVMLRHLAQNGGQYDPAGFLDAFRAHFGYGGKYVGYIDGATRGTLDNARQFDEATAAMAATVPFDGTPRTAKTLLAKALPLLTHKSGNDLEAAFLNAIQDVDTSKEIAAYAKTLIATLSDVPRPTGASDIQLPAVAKLPALVALLTSQGFTDSPIFDEATGSAVRATSDHPTAETFGEISAHLMVGALMQGTVAGALSAARAVAPPHAGKLLDDAIAMEDKPNTEATQHFGLACDLPMGVPSAVHALCSSNTFANAVRANIYAGGDNCGRAILVGAVMGAVHGTGGAKGIPVDWIDKCKHAEEAQKLLAKLFG